MLVGFSRLDVTPPLGTPMAGTFAERLADGIVDPVELNTLAFSNGESTALLIVTDALGIRYEYATKIREMIAEECGVKENHIMIAATHTHSSFKLGEISPLKKVPVRSDMDDDHYVATLLRKYVDAARIAIGDLKEATISFGAEQASEPVSFVRRFLMKDGSVLTFPPVSRFSEVVRPMSEADNTLRLIRIDRKEGGSIALANFSTHPCIVVGTRFSPDWPGYLRRYVEKALPDVHCVALVGAQGDTNHINTKIPERQTGIALCERISRILADATLRAWENTTPSTSEKIAADVRLAYIKTRTDGTENYAEAKQNFDAYYEKKISAHIQQLAGWRRVINTRTMPLYQHVAVSAMRIGDVVLVGFGGEAFTEYANRSRALAPDKFVVAATCTNGYQGYLPTKQAFEDGGYESAGSYFSPTIEDELVGTVEEILRDIQ